MFFVDTDSFAQTISSITGRISIRVGNRYFPEKDWNDFPIFILNWWATEVNDFLLESKKEIDLLFMDGPFGVRLTKENGTSKIRFVVKDVEEDVAVMDTDELKKELLMSIRHTLSLCLEKCEVEGWQTDDTQKLSERYQTLCRMQIND